MSYNCVLPFPLGSKSTSAENAPALGSRYFVGGSEYVLVKSTGTISPAKCFLQWNDSEAYTVDAVTGNGELRGAVAGLGYSTQSDVVSGDYFFLLRRGRGTATTETSNVGAQVPFSTYGTDGKIGDVAVTAATQIGSTAEAQASVDSDIAVNVDLS